MKMIAQKISWKKINRDKWNEMVSRCPHTSIYNTWNWIQTIHEAYDSEINVTIVKNEAIYYCALPLVLTFTPFIGKRYISLPYSDHYPFLLLNDSKSNTILNFLFNNMDDSIQIRDEIERMSKKHIGYYHTLNLTTNPGEVFQKFEKKQVQQRIKKLDYNELNLETGTTDYFFENLYNLLLSSRIRLNSFHPSKKYFRALSKYILQENKGYIGLVKYRSKIIAGGLFLTHNKTVYFKHGASLTEYWNLHPNHFLIWEIIKRSCFKNFDCFDFGRTGIENNGLRIFKTNWGAYEKKLFYSIIRGPSTIEIERAIKLRKYISSTSKYIPGFSKYFNYKFYKHFP